MHQAGKKDKEKNADVKEENESDDEKPSFNRRDSSEESEDEKPRAGKFKIVFTSYFFHTILNYII